jgi:hypothetical protein
MDAGSRSIGRSAEFLSSSIDCSVTTENVFGSPKLNSGAKNMSGTISNDGSERLGRVVRVDSDGAVGESGSSSSEVLAVSFISPSKDFLSLVLRFLSNLSHSDATSFR